MVTSTDNWLDSLVKHPIFETDQKQRVDIAEHTNNVEQFILQHHICILTMRDNDLFVAVGSKIRVLNLTEFKEAHNKSSDDDYSALSSVHYKLLDTPEIDFDIQSLTLNLNGRLLSVKGKHSLVVVCLPRQGFGDVLLKREVDCRTLAVGKKYYQKAQLIKVSWHPLSETRTHLVVLDSDSMLRIFDMSTDIEEPEQSFDLSPIENNSETNTDLNRGFSFQEKDVNGYEDAVTFSLGGNSQEQSGWEPFTVYYALRNGHIYSICPVIPFQSVVHQEHLNYLLCLTEAKYKKETSLNNKALASLHRRSLKWLRDLFNSAKISKRNGLAQSVVHSSTLPVKRQGPFLVNYHQDASIHSQVTDILYVASEPIHLLVVALSNGQIQNHILSTESNAQWQISKTDDSVEKELNTLLSQKQFLPTAILYETVDIKSKASPSAQSVQLVSDPLYKETYYAYHSSGVTSIDVKCWVNGLKARIENKDVRQWMSEKTTSKVRCLINTAPLYGAFAPVAGVFLMTNAYLSYRLIAITFDYHMSFVDLNMHSEVTQQEKQSMKHQLKGIAEDEQKSYESLLPLPLYKLPEQSDCLPTHTKILLPKELEDAKTLVINEDSLDLFSTLAKKVRDETDKLNKTAIKSKERLGLQQKEFENQIKSLIEIYNKYQTYFSSEGKKAQEDVMQEITQKHAQLRLRMDNQIRLVLTHCKEEMEEEWVEKMRIFSEKLTGTSGYVSRIQQLQKQLEQLNIQSRKERKFNPTNMSKSQLENLLSALKEQSDPINEIKQRLESLDKVVST